MYQSVKEMEQQDAVCQCPVFTWSGGGLLSIVLCEGNRESIRKSIPIYNWSHCCLIVILLCRLGLNKGAVPSST